MTPAEFKEYVHFKAGTDDNSFPDSKILLLAGIHMDKLAQIIVKDGNEDYFGMPLTTDLEANRREYYFESEILNQLKYVEAKLDGSKFIPLFELDLNTYQRSTDEDVITSIFSNDEGNAFFDIFRGALKIYSGTVSAVSGGLRVWSFTYPKHITDLTSGIDMSVPASTTDHGFPRSFHDILARLVAREYKRQNKMPLDEDETEVVMKRDIDKALETIKDINLGRSIVGRLPDASKRGNEGYDF
jgi:hypothetical protein